MALTDTLKRAPRWAWVTAAGIGLGAGAITLYRHRAAPPKDAAATDATADPYGGPLPTTTGNPVATIVPPVLVGGGGSNGSDLFASLAAGIVGGWQDVLGSSQGVTDQALGFVGQAGATYQDIWGPVQQQQSNLLAGFASTIQDLAAAGGAPSSTPVTDPNAQAGPPTINVYVPPAAAAPSALPPAAAAPTCPSAYPNGSPGSCYRTEYDNRTRDNGKTGAARSVWCNRVTIHRYQDGRPAVVVAEDKIKNGAC